MGGLKGRVSTLGIATGKSANMTFSADASKRGIFVISGAYGANDTVHDVIPVDIPSLTTTLTNISGKVKHLGSYTAATVYAAKISDGRYRIKYMGLTASCHATVVSNCEVDNVVYE